MTSLANKVEALLPEKC